MQWRVRWQTKIQYSSVMKRPAGLLRRGKLQEFTKTIQPTKASTLIAMQTHPRADWPFVNK